jgi:DNA invertase Pin-like site-specific DNA recombinase
MSKRLRCAIYTRKSSEEGLEQNFNSLHAQREACEAYVLSQMGEGWSALKMAYDDGGFSGGSMQRPGLQRLMEDIGKGHVDVVVVYKVDRLTRSLADFAKIVELFDAKGVSFVSVTQAFNTTSSMGRLTLNVLLSFAQFEREVTGERIRDKVAASKAKGLRMGGCPPLGYDIKNGRLEVNEGEAVTVRHIFTRYLELGSALKLQAALKAEGVTAKRWITKRGAERGGGFMGRGPLHYLLCNPCYRGATRHKEKRYPDTHPAIVDQELWDKVQASLGSTNARQPSGELRVEEARLRGLLFNDRGHPMAVVHSTRGSMRYRYYVSFPRGRGANEPGSLDRISAGQIEQLLAERLAPRLAANWKADDDCWTRIRAGVTRIVVGRDRIVVHARCGVLMQGADVELAADLETLCLPIRLARSRGAVVMDAYDRGPSRSVKIDRALVRAVALAVAWSRQLERGEVASVKALAQAEGLCVRYTGRLLPLAYLAPDLLEMIAEGRHPRRLNLKLLTAQPLPTGWADQRALLLE